MTDRPSSGHFSQVSSMNDQRPPNTPPRPVRLVRNNHQQPTAKDTPPSHARVGGPIDHDALHTPPSDLAQQETITTPAYSNDALHSTPFDFSRAETITTP